MVQDIDICFTPFLRSEFAMTNLEVHPEQVRQRKAPLVNSKNLANTLRQDVG